jgi:hypothetical protein
MTAKLVDQFVFVSLLVLAALLAVSGLDKLSALAQVISIMRHEGLFDALMRIEAFVAVLGCWECFLAASLLMRSFSAWTLGLTLITFLGFIWGAIRLTRLRVAESQCFYLYKVVDGRFRC